MTAGITLIGLGPGSSQEWTLAAYHHLTSLPELYLRTAHHPSLSDLTAECHAFDAWYEQATDFEAVSDQIAQEIARLGHRPQGVSYAVPGHPLIGEPTVTRIMALAQAQGLPIHIISGVSFLEPTLTALNLNPFEQLQIVQAPDLATRYHPPLNPDSPALITRLYGLDLVQRLQQTLLNCYSPQLTVTLVRAAGRPDQNLTSCQLADLTQHAALFDELTTLYLPADPDNTSLVTFQNTIAHLLSPVGCPWDREQTHRTLRPYLLEETYEVLEAIDADNLPALAEELGDLLLQIALHTQIATRDHEFRWGEVMGQIQRKMIRRHPHVFGEVQVSGAGEVVKNWEAIKKAEKAKSERPHSVLAGIPKGLPALAEALQISKKVIQAGFEWTDTAELLAKIVEEAQEIAEATEAVHLESEIGDLLFMLVNLARWRKIDPESALRSTNARFTRRVQCMEQLASPHPLTELSVAELRRLWQEAKKMEKAALTH